MNPKLGMIRQKVGDILFGLVRYKTPAGYHTWQVKAVPGERDTLICLVADDWPKKMLNKEVNFIQKYKNDYLFIAGKISAERRKDSGTVLSIFIKKACWFERHSDRATSWLKEKLVYENHGKEQLGLAS